MSHKDTAFSIQNTPKKSGSKLDTLAQLAHPNKIKGSGSAKKTFLKRAETKYISNSVALKLADLRTPFQQSYYNTYHCSETLQQVGKSITSRYCNNRWCLTCNRIRTAKLINGYVGVLSKLEDKQFVTLTVPNVSAEQLPDTLALMAKTFNAIRKRFTKYTKTPIVGIRKLEITYNPNRQDFHPHYHFLVSGRNVSELLVSEWLKRFSGTGKVAQDVRQADDKSVMELFKYFTKIVTKEQIHIKPLDVIFSSMRGMRVFQPMGIKKDVDENIKELQSERYKDLEDREVEWTWIDTDWIDRNTGEMLTGYSPSETFQAIVNSTV